MAEKDPADKRSVFATYYLAKAYARDQKQDKALETLEKFISANPEHPLLAGAYLLQGEIPFGAAGYGFRDQVIRNRDAACAGQGFSRRG